MFTEKRWPPAEELKQNRAETVNIDNGAGLSGRAFCLLRRDVSGRAENSQGAGEITCGVEPFRQAEVAHQRLAASIEQNVSGLEISMNNALVVCRLDTTCDLCQ